ncbi:hypothetical protein [Nostoc foliaceum]|uniref:Uncharacterized protein n=2 Tax=Nostoc TaxID=1177 RepID=A0ABR8I8F7_9NOSO|nr:hypothetical protein [Nostoc foliaceum]MBD2562697.1 hypothetical protein [Nostoc linckia FACHB-391]MBD2647735.1 hypothetical protein [Nostoc foliaceum FACHB-393]
MLDSVATNNLENNGLSLQTKDNVFKTIVTNLNADKKGLDIDEIIDAIKTVIVEVIDLKITTWVAESSDQPKNEIESPKPGNRIYTRINLVNGDIQNEIGSQFTDSGPYKEIREFHLTQVKDSREIIQKNIESVEKLYGFFMEIVKYRKKSEL